MSRPGNILVLTLLVWMYIPQAAQAVAYCALRDPVDAIQSLYPEADDYYSIVRIIGPETRDHVATRLPFSLHFNELGRHTLYVATRQKQPIGIIHSRSESSAWGLVEIIWSFNTDLTIRDFRFQRCRSSNCDKVASPAFKAQLTGKSAAQLKQLITDDGDAIRPGAVTVPDGADALALSVLRSALKTGVVTRYVWWDDLLIVRVHEIAAAGFPAAYRIDSIDELYSDRAENLIAKQLLGSTTVVNRETARAWRVLDEDDGLLGRVVSAELDLGEYSGTYLWAFSPDSELVDVKPAADWPSTEVRRAFTGLEGRKLSSAEECESAVSLAIFELGAVLQAKGDQP